MGMTIGEKIIARAAKVDQVKAGEIHTIEVDRLMSNDGTTHLTIDMYHNQLKRDPRDGKVTTGGIVTVKDSTDNWYLSWTTMCLRRVQKQQQHIERCVILQKSMRSNYMKEKVSAIRSW